MVDITARKALEQEQKHLLAETRAHAEREALLNQIGMAARGTQEPEAILQARRFPAGVWACEPTGVILFDTISPAIPPESSRNGSAPKPVWNRWLDNPFKCRRFRWTGTTDSRRAVPMWSMTWWTTTPKIRPRLTAINIRSILRVPIEVGDQMTALAVAMANEPRHWVSDEVRLVENVATLLRVVLESAHIRQRERNIAHQLQDALMPPSPGSIPGLVLASYYRPALAEASVGGDFFDVFGVEKGCTALGRRGFIGKGTGGGKSSCDPYAICCASRYTWRERFSEAMTRLHDALVEHDLLTGFATLFVGMYDHSDQNHRTLTYVNCGQEPGLIWRAATGQVEVLMPTGPVLGGFMAEGFEQKVVSPVGGGRLSPVHGRSDRGRPEPQADARSRGRHKYFQPVLCKPRNEP